MPFTFRTRPGYERLLPPSEVQNLRSNYGPGVSLRELAHRSGRSKSAIHRLVQHQTYRDVPDTKEGTDPEARGQSPK